MNGARGSLKATGLSKSFDGVTAVEHVDLEVGDGEILGLIGPNGSGKTTLVNLITGVVRPDSGRVACDGREWKWLAPHRVAKRGIGRTYQNIRLFGSMTVFENVAVAAAADGRSKWERRAGDVIAELGLAPDTDRPVNELPYGIQRRVEMARALARRPRYLFLDEPAAGLDEDETKELGATLAGIRNRYGCGLVLIEHDVPLVMAVSDTVIALNEGTVIAAGEPEDVRADSAVRKAYLG